MDLPIIANVVGLDFEPLEQLKRLFLLEDYIAFETEDIAGLLVQFFFACFCDVIFNCVTFIVHRLVHGHRWLQLIQQEDQVANRDPPSCVWIVVHPQVDQCLDVITNNLAEIFLLRNIKALDYGCDRQIKSQHGNDYTEGHKVEERGCEASTTQEAVLFDLFEALEANALFILVTILVTELKHKFMPTFTSR